MTFYKKNMDDLALNRAVLKQIGLGEICKLKAGRQSVVPKLLWQIEKPHKSIVTQHAKQE